MRKETRPGAPKQAGSLRTMPPRTKADVHEQVAVAINQHVGRPCRYWLWVDVRGTSKKPDRIPPPDVETVASETATWVRLIEPDPAVGDRPRETWITDDSYEIRVIALHERSRISANEAPVANPLPPEFRAGYT